MDNFEPDEDDAQRMYDEFLDECYADCLKGPFEHMRPSYLLKECDDTMYRCGFVDWLDGELRSNPEIFEGYTELEEALEEAEDFERSEEWDVICEVAKVTGEHEGWVVKLEEDEGKPSQSVYMAEHDDHGTYKVVLDSLGDNTCLKM